MKDVFMNSFFYALIFTLSFSISTAAQETPAQPEETPVQKTEPEPTLWEKTKAGGEKALDAGKKAAQKVEDAVDSTKSYREKSNHHLLASYSLIDMWIPGKWGVSYSFLPSAQGGWEIEYLRGTMSVPFVIDDLGKITDQRLSLFYRSYSQRNSFNFIYGVNYSSFKAHLGNDILAAVSGGNVAQYDLLTIRTIGLTWGLGNRWYVSNRILMGVDWLTINIPVATLEANAEFLEATASEDKKNDVRDALDIIKHVPTLAIFKLQVGVSF